MTTVYVRRMIWTKGAESKTSLKLIIFCQMTSECTFGGVYVPYSHVRCSNHRRFRSLLLCPLSVEHCSFPLFVDSSDMTPECFTLHVHHSLACIKIVHLPGPCPRRLTFLWWGYYCYAFDIH